MSQQLPSGDRLEQLIRDAIDRRIQEVCAEEVEAAISRVRVKIPELVAGVSLAVGKMFDVQRGHDSLLIHVVLREKA